MDHRQILKFNVYGPCIVSIFQYISNKMQRYTVYLYLETVLHVSGGTITHHQERKQLYLQHLVFVTPLLLPAADDGWWNHPKHVEQFPNKINCVTLHLVGYTCILEYILQSFNITVPTQTYLPVLLIVTVLCSNS